MPTVIGLAVALVGFLLLLLGSMEAMLIFVMVNTLMVGSSAIDLGSTSIGPTLVALAFMLARTLLPGAGQMHNLRLSAASNSLLIAFGLCVIVGSVTLPFLFKNQVEILPLRPVGKDLMAQVPLRFSLQNITTTLYTTASCLMAVVSFVAARQPGAPRVIPIVTTVVIGLHVFFGLGDAFFGSTPFGLVTAFFRNGHYAQLEQSVGGLIRIKGICPEPSSYASFGVIWFVFTAELWLRNVRPRWTGPAAATMGAVLAISTSSTAYVGLAIYAAVVTARAAIMPSTLASNKLLVIAALGLLAATLVCALLVLYPAFAAKLGTILENMTVNKGQSLSGQVRIMAAEQGFNAFRQTYGLGVGAGSFRSSSLTTAIIGANGIIGLITFAFYIIHVWKPLRLSTYTRDVDKRMAIGAAASWAVLVQVAVVSVSASSSDPGTVMMMFAGLALGSRSVGRLVLRPPRTPAGWDMAPMLPALHQVLAKPSFSRRTV